jgi:hypothetical protein
MIPQAALFISAGFGFVLNKLSRNFAQGQSVEYFPQTSLVPHLYRSWAPLWQQLVSTRYQAVIKPCTWLYYGLISGL